MAPSAPSDPMPTHPEATPVDPRPWRKQHPVLSRVLLFGLGVLIAGGLWWALQDRQAGDRRAELEGELVAMDTAIFLPGGAGVVQQRIEELFLGPDVPADLRARALRMRALALKRQAAAGDAEAREALDPAFEKALAAQAEDDARRGIHLEWAEACLERGDPDRAATLLDDALFQEPSLPWHVLHQRFRAAVDVESGDRARAIDRIEAALVRAPARPDVRPIRVGARAWPWSLVATDATEKLALLQRAEGQAPTKAWERLALWVDGDPRAQVICIAGLLDVGRADRARALLVGALEANADEVRSYAPEHEAVVALLAEVDAP